MKAIILAAGQGKRMRSVLQKNLQPLCGKPMIQYIVDACRGAGADDITVVISPGAADEMRQALPGVRFAVQTEPLGTGHAAQAAFLGEKHFADEDDILVLAGDMPLLTADFIRNMYEYYRAAHDEGAGGVVAAVHWPENEDFGRIYADEHNNFIECVEARDLKQKPDYPSTDWRSTSCYLFNSAALQYGLGCLTNYNAQQEYYLTDVPLHITKRGAMVKVFRCTDDPVLFTGVNTQAQLAEAAGHIRRRINARHMDNGVRMIDPAAVYIDDGVEIAADAVIYPGAVLEGACKIEAGAHIGAGVYLKDAHIGAGVKVLPHSVLTQARVGAGSDIGPFAYLRPGADIGERCRIGNFVEIKNAALGDEAKAAHLAYIGDAVVGKRVNFSCGAITANYDGKNKARTVIHDDAFIGSNATLIAPVEVGEWAFVAAGSTLNKNVPPDALAIGRARQEVKPDWKNDPRR